MKNLLLVLFLFPMTMMAAQSNPVLEAVSRALSAGDVDALARHLADNVDLSILENEQTCSKAKATELLRGFFNNNRPRSFNQVHQGASRGSNDQYCIGNLVTANGAFRVYIYLKVTGASAVVQELRFDRD
ncbi:MAG: DUF4783 domain-containing protein [Saprospiraceae bacterium]|nr:DUF4783 domain-containing protein [Saprospiraceae bacterium]MDW8228195.1 DUF4783 domain-containing protein [Saprospiraceae bacterium]